jgi:hypothetical protein
MARAHGAQERPAPYPSSRGRARCCSSYVAGFDPEADLLFTATRADRQARGTVATETQSGPLVTTGLSSDGPHNCPPSCGKPV